MLEVENLTTSIRLARRQVPIIQGVSFRVEAGRTMGIVGESGSGKSVTAQSVMRLLPTPPYRIESGQVRLEGTDLLSLPESEMRNFRGNQIGMIFQEPMTALDPVFTVGRQLVEAIRAHGHVSRREAEDRAVEVLSLAQIPSPRDRLDDYPHQFSGGMRQRVLIAMALSLNPRLIIADEPTTALDVTVQAQILRLMQSLQQQFGMAMLLITHNFQVIAEVTDTVAVMYAGRVVETGRTAEVLRRPRHPYTTALLRCIPSVDRLVERLDVIPGSVPELTAMPDGCRFRNRCPFATEQCVEEPPLENVGSERAARCWHPLD